MKHIRIMLSPVGQLKVPLAHFEIMQGVAYRLLSYDREISTEVHDRKDGVRNAIKLFCFSDLRGRYFIENNMRIFEEPFEFELRSAHDRIVDTVAARLAAEQRLGVNGYDCIALWHETGTRYFCGGELALNMNTPIVTCRTDEEGYTRYYSPDEPEFYFIVENNLRRKYRAIFGSDYTERLELRRIWTNEKSKCVTKYKGTYITGYRGKYSLRAESDMQAVAYYCGLGEKNSQGFGLGDMLPPRMIM